MKYLENLAARIRRGETIPAPLGALLEAASLAQRAGMWRRLRQRRTRVSAHVVSFGNLTAGGVGKTPAVIERAERECAAGKRVAVLTRGHGAQRASMPLTLRPGDRPENIVSHFGDEAALIARRVPSVWIVRSPDRVTAAKIALEEGCDTLILDDGYQAVALERDENILLIDATNPFGNGRILPRGILREPMSAMARATSILLTRCDQVSEKLPEITAIIQKYAPDVSILKSIHKATHLWRVCDDTHVSLDMLCDTPVRVVTGIGNPEAFINSLTALGAKVTERNVLPDHAPLPEKALHADMPVLITEKDAARLLMPPPACVYALAVSLAFTDDN